MGLEKPKFKIHNKHSSPENLDYDIYGFHKKRTIVFGELITVEYYRNYNGTTYSDLILKETRTFFRDAVGLAQYRIQTTEWYLEDESIGCRKTTTKYYSPQESIEEGVIRRGNIIANAKIYTLSQLGQEYSFDLLTSVKSEIGLFLDGRTQPLRDAVNASTKPYLNSTIKAGIIENLRLV